MMEEEVSAGGPSFKGFCHYESNAWNSPTAKDSNSEKNLTDEMIFTAKHPKKDEIFAD
jgi:hypothetical protein